MIVNTPALDYFRGTTQKKERYIDVVEELLRDEKRDRNEWRFQQYRGDSYGGIAHGEDVFDSGGGYIVDISGEDAHDNIEILSFSDLNMTRIDLQLTIPKPEFWDTIEYHYEMELGVWPGRVRGVLTYLNQGNDTVAIGARASDRYIRVYVKERDWLRFECEFKGERAARAWKMVRNGGYSAIAGILLSECDKLPDSAILSQFRQVLSNHCDESLNVIIQRVKTSDIRQVRWLASLLPTIERMVNDSDYGGIVLGWLIDIVERRINSEEPKDI